MLKGRGCKQPPYELIMRCVLVMIDEYDDYACSAAYMDLREALQFDPDYVCYACCLGICLVLLSTSIGVV